MTKTKLYMAALAVVVVAGWTCSVNAQETQDPGLKTVANVGSGVMVSGKTMKADKDYTVFKDGVLGTLDRSLEAKAMTIIVNNAKVTKNGPPRDVDMVDKVSMILRFKGEPQIEASAKRARIDWQKKTIELQGDVAVTTYYQDKSGNSAPSTVKGDVVRISIAEKLAKGKMRVEPVTVDPKDTKAKASADKPKAK